jgi:6-phosphogluconolactonase
LPQLHDSPVSVFDDPGALMHAAAEKVVTTATTAVAARGRFMWALSGGSTPRGLFSMLARAPYVGRVEWDRVHFFWGDERCVPAEHPDSNYRMARETLLDIVHPPAANVHRMQGELAPPAGAAAYETTLRRVFFDTAASNPEAQNTTLPRFDLVLLGMGNDGHTASLFPGEPTLAEKERWVVATHVNQAIPDRMTVTLPVLNAAAHVVFLVAGADKAARLGEIFGANTGAPRLPAQMIRPVRGELQWLLDAPAAAAIPRATE